MSLQSPVILLANIAELEHVKFIMKGGVVVRSDFAIH
jgi:hypothetical protein